MASPISPHLLEDPGKPDSGPPVVGCPKEAAERRFVVN